MISVNIPDPLAQDAVVQAKVFNRTVDNQISYWAKIGKIAEDSKTLDNPTDRYWKKMGLW